MLDAQKIKKSSVKSDQVTFITNKQADLSELPNPYAPFKGKDGKTYVIGYNKSLNEFTNCYAFVMGWFRKADNKYQDYIPGFLARKSFSMENVVELVKADLESVGREVFEVVYDIPQELPDGEGYWIKALHCPTRDDVSLHFMRKDTKSGIWIHKMGWEMPPKIVVKYTKTRNKLDALLDTPQMQGYSKEFAKEFVKRMFPKEMYSGETVEACEIEKDDSAPYISFSEGEEFLKYEPLWAMRVSEP